MFIKIDKIGHSHLILTNLVGIHPNNIYTKFDANQSSGLRTEVEKVKMSGTTTAMMMPTTHTSWSLIECD